MASCEDLQHIFDKPSWNHINPIDNLSQMHFKHNTDSDPSGLGLSPPFVANDSTDKTLKNDSYSTKQPKHHQHNTSFSSMSSESLSMCTEGLGFESFDDVEELKNEGDGGDEWKLRRGFDARTKHAVSEVNRSRITGVEFPPPISSIGRSGTSCVCLKAYRENGRFILKEVRIPTQEFLHACREEGRLKLRFIQSTDDTVDEDDEDE